jgi:hypothetical protein
MGMAHRPHGLQGLCSSPGNLQGSLLQAEYGSVFGLEQSLRTRRHLGDLSDQKSDRYMLRRCFWLGVTCRLVLAGRKQIVTLGKSFHRFNKTTEIFVENLDQGSFLLSGEMFQI